MKTLSASFFSTRAVDGIVAMVFGGAMNRTLANIPGLRRRSGLLNSILTFVRRVSVSTVSPMRATVPRKISPA